VNVGIRHKSKSMHSAPLRSQYSSAKWHALTECSLHCTIDDGASNDDMVVATMMKGPERPRPCMHFEQHLLMPGITSTLAGPNDGVQPTAIRRRHSEIAVARKDA